MAAEIQNCNSIFKVQCPLHWEQLTETADLAVWTCGVCLQNVYLCETDEQLVAHAKLEHCVALVQYDRMTKIIAPSVLSCL
jgi:hypothetical protein